MTVAYSEYRVFDAGWVQRIPSHWQLKRLKYLGKARIGLIYDPSELVGNNEGVMVLQANNIQNGKISLRNTLRVAKSIPPHLRTVAGDILICSRNGSRHLIGKCALIDAKSENLSFGAFTTVFRSPMNSYIFWAFNSQLFKAQSGLFMTATINQLTLGSLNNFVIPVPPRPEQDQIVAYLRAQDAHIARFIKTKRDLIKLLTEQKLRIIDHAVTRGLDASVVLKSSGIEWLGEVPEHWEVALIKHVADVRFSGVDKHSHDNETPVRLCNYTDVYKNDHITDDMDLMRATATAAEIARLTLKAGDVILTKDSETPDDIGVPAWVPEDLPGVVCAYHLGLLRPVPDRVLGEFLFRAIGSARTAQQFHVLATGVTRFALGKHDVKNAVIALPPVEEQKTICCWITHECQPIDDTIARTEDEIKLIREYRDRLIADVVTGQVDVRGWVPGPDDVVAEEDLAALGGDEEIDTDGEADNGDD